MILFNMFLCFFIVGCFNNSIENNSKKWSPQTDIDEDNININLNIVNDNKIPIVLIDGELGKSIGIQNGIIEINLTKGVSYIIKSLDSNYYVKPNVLDLSNKEDINRKYYVNRIEREQSKKKTSFFSLKFNANTLEDNNPEPITLSLDRGSNIIDRASFIKPEIKKSFRWDIDDSYEVVEDSSIEKLEKVIARSIIPKKENRVMFDIINGQSKKKSEKDNSIYGISEIINLGVDILNNKNKEQMESS